MIWNLVKKDILIAKKLVFVTMLVVIAIPIFISWTAPLAPDFIPFLYMVVMAELLLLNAISQEEGKCPKAAALLCATPYTRHAFVIAKYLFLLVIFAYCYIVHTLVMLVMANSISLNPTTILTVFLLSVFIYGIYMPVEFKYGVTKAKFIFMIIILLFSLGPSMFVSFFTNINIDFSTLMGMSPLIKNFVLVSASVAVFGTSMMTSMKIFSKKDL